MKKVILDTDIGTDSDDIGAIALLQNLAKNGKVELLCMTSCSSMIPSAQALDLINTHYHNRVSVGINVRTKYAESPLYGSYARAICSCFKSDKRNFEDAVLLLRKTLQGSAEKISIITIGPLNNLSNLLDSLPDLISDKNGADLVYDKVDKVFVMGGNFISQDAEWNIKEDVVSAQNVLSKLKSEVIFCPFEVGVQVKSGVNLLKGTSTPMQVGYYVHNNGARESWDPITAYLGATEDFTLLPLSNYGAVSIDARGVTTFKEGNGKHRYVLDTICVRDVTSAIEQLMIP
ncbi:MAG: nucleoside hydrolase [Clostridia bacterium]